MATATVKRGTILSVPVTIPGLVKGFKTLTKKDRVLAFLRVAKIVVGK